jgi:uncharacterized protein YfeS
MDEWRAKHPRADAEKFLALLLGRWDVRNEDWDCLDRAVLSSTLPSSHFHVLTRDDVVIAIAFGQLVLDGRVDPKIQQLALLSVQRQVLPEVIGFRGWVDAAERRTRLGRMKDVLERMPLAGR